MDRKNVCRAPNMQRWWWKSLLPGLLAFKVWLACLQGWLYLWSQEPPASLRSHFQNILRPFSAHSCRRVRFIPSCGPSLSLDPQEKQDARLFCRQFRKKVWHYGLRAADPIHSLPWYLRLATGFLDLSWRKEKAKFVRKGIFVWLICYGNGGWQVNHSRDHPYVESLFFKNVQ